jgi:ribosomal protein L19
MNQLFQQLLQILTVTVTQATIGANKANEGLGLLKQYIDGKFIAVQALINNINGAINTAVENVKTILRGEINTAKNEANAYTDTKIGDEVTARNTAIETAKTSSQQFATTLVQGETSARSQAITDLGMATTTQIAGVNTDLSATKARISAIETSDAGSADDFLPFTIVAGATSTVQAALTAAAAELNVTVEADRTYLLLFRGGGGSHTLTRPNYTTETGGPATIDYVVNAGEKMRVKIAPNGTIQYVIHIEDPYAEQLSSVEYGVGQINLSLTNQNGQLITAVNSLTSTVSQLAAAVAAQQGN